MSFEAEDIPVAHFCALQYSAREMIGPTALETIIVLLIRYESGALRVLSRQDWPSIVQPKDLEYIRELLFDFRERASSAPDALFQQVSALSTGPLVTYAVGTRSDLKSFMELLQLFEKMVDLS